MFCSGHNKWCGDMVSVQWRGWRQQWEGREDAKGIWCESMKPSDVIFLHQDTFPFCLHPWLWLDSQGGMCSLLFRPMYLTLNHAIQVTVCEVQTPQVEKLLLHSAVGCHLKYLFFRMATKFKKKKHLRWPDPVKPMQESCSIIRAILIYLLQTMSKGIFWMFIHFFIYVLRSVYCWLGRECTWICFHNDFTERSKPTEFR